MRDRRECEYLDTHGVTLNGCKLLRDENRCNPETCGFYMTHKDRIASLAKAARQWQKAHPHDDNYVAAGVVPKRYAEEVIEVLNVQGRRA
jgi:hypothetical protein